MRHGTALRLAQYSQLAYEDLDTVKAALPNAKITLLNRDDSQAYVIETSTETVVSFRGTQVTSDFSMQDIIRNTKIALVPLGLSQNGKIHRGYKEAVDVIAEELAEAVISVPRPLLYTGHSLGGAMATYARILVPHPNMTVTFGSPKVGDQEFVSTHSRHPLIRYVHGYDIAPKHASTWLGYRHGGSLMKISRDGTVKHRPWRWYDELIIPVIAGIAVGTFDHRIGEYVAKLQGAEI